MSSVSVSVKFSHEACFNQIGVRFCLTGEGGCLLRSTLSGQSQLCAARALACLPKVFAKSTHILWTDSFIFVQPIKSICSLNSTPHIQEGSALSRKTFWCTFSRLGDALDVHLWPFGKATTRKLRSNNELSSRSKSFLYAAKEALSSSANMGRRSVREIYGTPALPGLFFHFQVWKSI